MQSTIHLKLLSKPQANETNTCHDLVLGLEPIDFFPGSYGYYCVLWQCQGSCCMAKPSNSFFGDLELSQFFRLSGPGKWKNTVTFSAKTIFQR